MPTVPSELSWNFQSRVMLCTWADYVVHGTDPCFPLDHFEAVMMREGCERGFFAGSGFSSDAEREVERFWKQSGRLIELLTVQEIWDEEVARKIA